MQLDIEYIWQLKNALALINKMPLENIEFYDKGIKLDIDEELIEEFNFMGLNNVDFIISGYYRRKPIESSTFECSIGITVDKSKAVKSIQKPLKPLPYYKKKCGCTGTCMCWGR
jgi:hypothetical protein